jgi:uncharacterized protein (DUF58 family)
VRLFDNTPSSDWWILLDMDEEVQAGEGQDSTEEHSVILGASLAHQGLHADRAVGFVAGGGDFVWLPPREGRERRWDIMRALALVSPGRYPLTQVLARVKPAIDQYASLVIITPNVRGGWLEGLLPLIWRGVVPTVFLLDPVSFGGEGQVAGIEAALTQLGVSHYVISRDTLDRPEARPGKSGRWEWQVTPMGRAIPVREPEGMDWKVLS